MPKASLNSMAEEFIQKKTLSSQNTKTPSSQDTKKQQTIYLTLKAYKLAWQNRADNGETITDLVNRLIVENLDSK